MSKNTGSKVVGAALMFAFAPACVIMNGWWGTGMFMFVVGMIIYFKGER
jgi:hypothetical protein